MGKGVLTFKRLMSEEGVRKAKQEIDKVAKYVPKLAFDPSNLEGNLRKIAEFVREKGHLEHEREVFVKLLSARADLMKQLQTISSQISLALERAKVHWPGRENIKKEIAKMRSEEHYIEFVLGHIQQVLKREHAPTELTTKLIELDVKIAELGGSRLAIAINNALKKSSIDKSDISKIAEQLK